MAIIVSKREGFIRHLREDFHFTDPQLRPKTRIGEGNLRPKIAIRTTTIMENGKAFLLKRPALDKSNLLHSHKTQTMKAQDEMRINLLTHHNKK